MQSSNYIQNQSKLRVNHQIRVPQVRVILDDGSNGGVMATQDAIKLAQEQSLDLVEINPKGTPPVCKIVNYGKFKYDEKKKQQSAKKSQVLQELKELTFRPNTDQNDLSHKTEQAKSFLFDGDKVKFTIRFRGREITHPQIGREKLEWIIQQLDGIIVPNPIISMEGKLMSMIVSPIKK